MDFARAVESLLRTTPKKAPRRQVKRAVSDTPEKDFPPAKAPRSALATTAAEGAKAAAVASLCAAAAKASQATSVPVARVEDFDKDVALTAKLFDGLESVLVLLASRKTRAVVPVVQENVGNFTQRDLTEERLERVLGVAGDMLEAVLVGSNVELVQRLSSGEARAPTNAERLERRAAFDERLALAVARGTLPRSPLPKLADVERPAARSPQNAAPRRSPSATEVAVTAKVEAPPGAAGIDRLRALRSRVLVRQASDKDQAAYRAKVGDVEQRIAVCEDAIAVHSILAHLFARGEGEGSAAIEAEVLSAITSSRFGMQTRRPIDAEAAKAALACLSRNAVGWFTTVEMQHSIRPGRILRRLPGGFASAAMDSLRIELSQLQDEHSDLLAKGPVAWAAESKAASTAGAQGVTMRRLRRKLPEAELYRRC